MTTIAQSSGSPPTNIGTNATNTGGTQASAFPPNQPQSIAGTNPPRDKEAINADKWKARFFKVGTWLICGAAVAVVLWFYNYSTTVAANNAAIAEDIKNINNNIQQLRSDNKSRMDDLQKEIDDLMQR